MINTYNETKLHKSLKTMYSSVNEGALTEQKTGDYIADILLPDGGIIEIQTASLANLKKKIESFIREKRRITVVHPVATVKYIETTDIGTGKTTRRKSPVKKALLSAFRELTSLTALLADRNFTLEVLETVITEERIRHKEPVQSRNGRRRFPKDWEKTDKRLEEILVTHRFHGRSSWIKLVPKSLRDREFTSAEFFEELKKDFPAAKRQDTDIMLWVYTKAGFTERIGKTGKAWIYRTL